jgi:hypothetical protein
MELNAIGHPDDQADRDAGDAPDLNLQRCAALAQVDNAPFSFVF